MVATASVAKAEEITVAYFLEWPMPFQYAKVKGLYDEALGMKVNWKAFDAGTAMSAAMASGDIHISVSQGVPPFVVATSAGQDLQVADIAVVYNDNDNCVVKTELEITKDSAKELEGKKVGVRSGPPLTMASSSRWNISASMFPPWKSSTWLRRMARRPLPRAASTWCAVGALASPHEGAWQRAADWCGKDAIGISVYDVTSVPASFAAENSEVLAKFLKVTADMNAKWLTDSAEMLPVIAKDAGMSEEDATDTLKGFQFPTVEAQLSDKWLGKATPEFLKGVGDFSRNRAISRLPVTPMMAP